MTYTPEQKNAYVKYQDDFGEVHEDHVYWNELREANK